MKAIQSYQTAIKTDRSVKEEERRLFNTIARYAVIMAGFFNLILYMFTGETL